jgi:hypothetical protein
MCQFLLFRFCLPFAFLSSVFLFKEAESPAGAHATIWGWCIGEPLMNVSKDLLTLRLSHLFYWTNQNCGLTTSGVLPLLSSWQACPKKYLSSSRSTYCLLLVLTKKQ